MGSRRHHNSEIGRVSQHITGPGDLEGYAAILPDGRV
jgi:hypothetical protein